MNTERLHSLIRLLTDANNKHNFIALLQKVEATYTQAVQSPSAPNAEAFNNAKNGLRNALLKFPLSKLSRSRTKYLESIGGLNYFGENLIIQIDTIISSAETPSNAITEIQKLRSEMSVFFPTLKVLDENLNKLKIATEDIPDDSAEIEVLIPMSIINGHLDVFIKETRYLNGVFCDIREAVTGKRTPLDIRSLGSGSLEFYFTIDLNTAAALLIFTTAVIQLINTILQTRRDRESLKKQEAPEKIIREIKDWEDGRIKDHINQLRDDLLEHYKGKEERKNELNNALSKSLNRLADRIDRGVDIDVTTAATVTEDTAAKTPSDLEKIESMRRSIESIRENTNIISQLERNREPVLQLPISNDE